MNKNTRDARRKLGYEVDDRAVELPNRLIPSHAFIVAALGAFFGGGYGLLEGSEDYIILFFTMSCAVAPALIIYPVLRHLFGNENALLSGLLSAAFGLLVQGKIKDRFKD